ncbi:hypothetical protein Pcinc_018318 [Petrolisthes cinctipes]|uniref:Uncharacterized protein n=1 Tax=Petrolisthes cinctipes TaxID=88211 RepID=A0AAE1FSC2_PETCI|nr:hypothetical protein Pcinc_018318 [Petrolisthes cinctipes]
MAMWWACEVRVTSQAGNIRPGNTAPKPKQQQLILGGTDSEACLVTVYFLAEATTDSLHYITLQEESGRE